MQVEKSRNLFSGQTRRRRTIFIATGVCCALSVLALVMGLVYGLRDRRQMNYACPRGFLSNSPDLTFFVVSCLQQLYQACKHGIIRLTLPEHVCSCKTDRACWVSVYALQIGDWGREGNRCGTLFICPAHYASFHAITETLIIMIIIAQATQPIACSGSIENIHCDVAATLNEQYQCRQKTASSTITAPNLLASVPTLQHDVFYFECL